MIVDNCSTDGTNKEYVEALGAIYIQNSKNQGFGRACNIGLQFAIDHNATHVAILNQDAIVEPDTLYLLGETISKRDNVSIACPLILDQDKCLHQDFSEWLVRQNKMVLEDGLNGTVSIEYDVTFLNAALWMFNMDVLKKLGGFDPIFFMYNEDKEIAARFGFHGYKMVLNTKAKVIHNSSSRAELDTFSKRVFWSSVRSSTNMIGAMRNYNRPFYRNLPGALINWLRGLIANILGRNMTATLGYCLSIFVFIRSLNQNRKHYNLSKRGVPNLFFR